MNKKLFVISGCSGVGKSTVLKEFMNRNSQDFILSVSCTTRKPRPGEVDGVNYFFLSREEFQECIDNDKFLEYAQFAGNFYGTKKKFIKQKFEEGMNIILEIETQGALQVKQKMPEAVLIFIAPPGPRRTGYSATNSSQDPIDSSAPQGARRTGYSATNSNQNSTDSSAPQGAYTTNSNQDSIEGLITSSNAQAFDIDAGLAELERRLRGRNTEDEETIQRRLSEAKVEFERSKQYDYIVINDDLERAINEVESITRRELE